MSLEDQLGALEQAGLISLLARQPALEYLFRHALVQDAAYATLLKADRRALHLAVAQTLAPQAGGASDELAGLLAYHFAEGGEHHLAIGYYRQAGEAAMRLFATQEALIQYGAALRLLQDLGEQETAEAELVLALYSGLGRAFQLSNRFAEALERYAELEQLAQRRGDPALRLAALASSAAIYSTPNPAFDPEHGRQCGNEALVLARGLGDAT